MAYLQIVAQYGSIYHDETKSKAERARVPSQIIHEIRSRGGRFLEELDSGDWRETGDTRAIGKVRNALQHNKKTRKGAMTAEVEIVAPPAKEDNSQGPAESAQVVGPLTQGSNFEGIPPGNMTEVMKHVAPGSLTPEPTVYPTASAEGPKAVLPGTEIHSLCSQEESDKPPIANLKIPEDTQSIYGGRQTQAQEDASVICDFCFQPPQPKPNARTSSNESVAYSTATEFSPLTTPGVSIESSHQASAPGAPIASLTMDTTSSVLSPLLHDTASLSSSSAPEEVRSTERPRPQQQHEPDLAIRRMQNLVAGMVLDDVDDDLSEMSGYISGMSLIKSSFVLLTLFTFVVGYPQPFAPKNRMRFSDPHQDDLLSLLQFRHSSSCYKLTKVLAL